MRAMILRLPLAVLLVPAVVACASCSASKGSSSSGFAGAGGSGAGQSTGTGNGSGMGGTTGGLTLSTATGGSTGTDTADAGATLIYASTDTTLYTLDPTSANLTLTAVGDFDCIPSMNSAMTDIAVNQNGDLWGITGHDLYPLTIQGNNVVHCGPVIHLGTSSPTFYALSFAPVGVIDPAKEVLVAGNTAGELWAIDSQGNLTQHGVFGTVPPKDGQGNTYPSMASAGNTVGQLWELSGDIVFLHNGGNPVGFATVRDCPSPPSTTGCSYVDTLIEIDMTMIGAVGKQAVAKGVRGQLLKATGCHDGVSGDYGSMFGIASWNSVVYGFSRTGNLVNMDNSTGQTCLVKNYSPNKFSGAAVTTLAPVVPPPPIK
jgi:hypothetical protein